MRVKISLHGQPVPESHDSWDDLTTAEDTVLRPMEYTRISLGVAVEIPDGYEALIVPRHVLCERYGVICSTGCVVIKNNYCSDGDVWKLPVIALQETYIPKGVRICQFRLIKCSEPLEFLPVEKLSSPNRGGWGSTGL